MITTVEERRGSILFRIFMMVLAGVLFIGAAALSRHPIVPQPATPDAADVRVARTFALRIRDIVVRPGPQPLRVSQREFESIARVVSDGVPRLRLGSDFGFARAQIGMSLRLNENSWLNTVLILTEERDRGFPVISARIGNLSVPAFVMTPVIAIAHDIARLRAGVSLPSPRDMIMAFETHGDAATVSLDLPRGLLHGARKLAPENSDAIDGVLVDQLYARMAKRLKPDAPVDLATVYIEAFAGAPTYGAAARRHARAAMVAVAMLTTGSPARNLADDGSPYGAASVVKFPVELAGRNDLAKHFSLSAAIASATNVEFGRALGTWKELDDSLPGGSGFSFVDLAADRAGLRFGQAALEPARAARLSRLLQRETPPQLLPDAALRFEENLDNRAFSAQFGDTETDDYAAVIARIDRSLDTLPLMRR